MAFVAITLFQSPLTAFLTAASTTMKVSSAAAAQISAALAPGDFTIFLISNGVQSEIVYCTGAVGTTATITRAQEGTVASNFAVNTSVRFVWTPVGVQAQAGGGSAGITIAGDNSTAVTGGPFDFVVDTPYQALTAGTGISVSGGPFNWTITNTLPGSVTTPTVVTGSGVADVTPISGGYNVDVPLINFTNGTGISITGTWPNFTVTNTAPASGGSGTVTSVTAGGGITVTGTPTVAPVVALTPTGISAGTYGGITINVYGQISAVASSLITSITSSDSSITVAAPVAGVVDIKAPDATTSVKGRVKLAVPNVAGSSDPADSTSAVSPAGVAAVLAAAVPIIVSADIVNVALPSASYSNIIVSSASPINLAAGKTAIVRCQVDVADTATPTNIPNFGISLFLGVTFIDGNEDNTACGSRELVVKLTGPQTGTLILATTPMVGAFTVQSRSITVISN